jgi:CHAT domain-containing protein
MPARSTVDAAEATPAGAATQVGAVETPADASDRSPAPAKLARRPHAGAGKPEPPTRLSVVNGDFALAGAPVVVGHFLGDSIAGAEAQLDFALGGALKQRYALGLYPGPVGSAAVISSREGDGAVGVVVGLGDISSLGPGAIRTALVAGLLEFAVSPAPAALRDGVVLVLLGSRAGTVSVADTLSAMLEALAETRRRLAAQGLEGAGRVQFVSVYEDDAHRLWHTLRRYLDEPHYRGRFVLDDEIAYAAGAQRRLMRMEDPDAWQAVQVTAAEAGDGQMGFRFTAAGDRARAEAFSVGADRAFVKQFVAAVQIRKLDVAPTRALFQLIWPAELKQTSRNDRNVRLILDEAAAALPFELMDDRAADDPALVPPPVVRRGMLRQLIQTRFARLQATPRGGHRALVVGDPRGGPQAEDFPALPGARAEAEAVADLLEQQGFEVVRLIGDEITPDQVLERVLEGGWTVLHVSAHGVYDYPFRSDRNAAKAGGWDGDWTHFTGPRHTGVVLGDKLTLAPSILNAMPEPPVFAFINCCNLATVDADEEERLRAAGRPEFAAGFAAELIALGARAVIAAGWEVSDQGALTFARSVYRELLENAQGFGDAVRIARGDVYDAQPDDATWGAYQCYGEPDWRLRPEGEARRRRRPAPVFASPAEAAAAVEGLRNRALVGGERAQARAELTSDLEAIAKKIVSRGWKARDGVAEHIARAFVALGEEERAVAWFEEALNDDAAPSLGVVEALARLRLRASLRPGSHGLDEAPVAALARVEAIREQLTLLCTVAGATAQRLALIGKAADRAAQLSVGDARDAELARMRDAYRQAWKLGRARDPAEACHAGLMAVTASVLLTLRSGLDGAECRDELEELASEFAARTAPGDYGRAAAEIGRRLLAALIDQGLSAERANALIAEFRAAWQAERPGGDEEPVLEPLRLISAVLSDSDSTRPMADWVASIENGLTAA